jgi:hypothetical protein
VSAILSAFDKYEVVGMPEAHGMKDLDDFIFSLIRNPEFPEKVNDIVVECGNSLYQPVLDRYIAGDDVPFGDVRKVWRNTTQPMCGMSGFFEQFFPLVRAINQELPLSRRIRVLAGDPPIDWAEVKAIGDARRFLGSRDVNVASVMEREVLSKHDKALMLFGEMHLFHTIGTAVSLYEKNYPNVTFVIADSMVFDIDSPDHKNGPFVGWPAPSLALTKGTWLGDSEASQFWPPMIKVDQDCNVEFSHVKELQKPLSELADAVLYLGPRHLSLKEPIPADIALDASYMMELQRRAVLAFPGTPASTIEEMNQENMSGAENPFDLIPDFSRISKDTIAKPCLEGKRAGGKRQ